MIRLLVSERFQFVAAFGRDPSNKTEVCQMFEAITGQLSSWHLQHFVQSLQPKVSL